MNHRESFYDAFTFEKFISMRPGTFFIDILHSLGATYAGTKLHALKGCFNFVLKNILFNKSSLHTLPPTPNWSPYIFMLVQKVKIGHKKHDSVYKQRLCRDSAIISFKHGLYFSHRRP